MKELKRTPIEIFGYDTGFVSADLELAIKQQYCRFIHGTCNKPRKSNPQERVGICSVASTVTKRNVFEPVIVCPQRFKVDFLLETIRQKYLKDWSNVTWIPEVNIGVGGSIDYVAVEMGKKKEIQNFQCVELQAAGTTGTPFPAVIDLKKHSKFLKDKYNYGINWANEFLKTMMQQAYKKGKIVQSWNRKIVFVIQDVGMKYILKSADCSLLTKADTQQPVDFCVFRMKWTEDEGWKLEFDQIYSTSVEGINRMIGGAGEDQYLTEEDFKQNILKKGLQDKLIA